MRVHYDNLFLAPLLHMQAPRAVPLNYVEGQTFEEYFTVVNRTPVAHRRLVSTVTSFPPNAFSGLKATGTAEYLALWARSIGHERWFYWYVTACIFGSLVVYATMRETRGAIETVEPVE